MVHTRALSALSYLVLDGQFQDLFEGVYGVLSTNRIALKVPNVVVCGEEDPNYILFRWMLALDLKKN